MRKGRGDGAYLLRGKQFISDEACLVKEWWGGDGGGAYCLKVVWGTDSDGAYCGGGMGSEV